MIVSWTALKIKWGLKSQGSGSTEWSWSGRFLPFSAAMVNNCSKLSHEGWFCHWLKAAVPWCSRNKDEMFLQGAEQNESGSEEGRMTRGECSTAHRLCSGIHVQDNLSLLPLSQMFQIQDDSRWVQHCTGCVQGFMDKLWLCRTIWACCLCPTCFRFTDLQMFASSINGKYSLNSISQRQVSQERGKKSVLHTISGGQGLKSSQNSQQGSDSGVSQGMSSNSSWQEHGIKTRFWGVLPTAGDHLKAELAVLHLRHFPTLRHTEGKLQILSSFLVLMLFP